MPQNPAAVTAAVEWFLTAGAQRDGAGPVG